MTIRLVSLISYWLSALASRETRLLRPIVPQRTRMVRNPQTAEFFIPVPSLREVAASGAGASAFVEGSLGENCGAPLLSGIQS